MAAGLSQPFEHHEGDDYGSSVVVAALVSLVATLPFVITRVILAKTLNRDNRAEHGLSLLGSAFAIAQTAMVIKSVQYGLGKHQSILSREQFANYSKFRYVGQFLIICVLTSTKLSMIVFYKGLTQQKRVILACDCLLGLVLGWAIFSIFTIAFQCNLRDPWVYSPGRCTAEGDLAYLIAAGNILTDLVLAIGPMAIISRLQMPVSKRWVVNGLLGFRIVVPAAAVVRLKFMPTYLRSTDTTWTNVNPTICGQIIMNLSLFATTLPFLHRMLASLHTGVLGTTLISEELELSRYGTGTHVSRPKTSEPSTVARSELNSSMKQSRMSQSTPPMRLRPGGGADIRTTIGHDPTMTWSRSGGRRDMETESTENLTSAEDSIIKTLEIKIDSNT